MYNLRKQYRKWGKEGALQDGGVEISELKLLSSFNLSAYLPDNVPVTLPTSVPA